MKLTEFIVETSLIAQEADIMHQDHEVQMARADCYNAAQYAIELHKLLKNMSEEQGLEGWVSEKITLANDYLRTVAEYLRHEQAHEEDMMTFAEDAANYALDNLLNEDRRPLTNFDIEDIKNLEQINDLPTLKAQALELISRPSKRPMKQEKINWFANRLESLNSRISVIKLMYDLLLSGEGHAVIGSKYSMDPNSYRQRFNESYVGRETKEGTWRVFKTGQAVAVAGPFKSAAEANAWIKKQSKKSVKESASAGATGAGSVAVSMSGPTGKPGTGKPKKISNAAKMKKVQVGKGIY